MLMYIIQSRRDGITCLKRAQIQKRVDMANYLILCGADDTWVYIYIHTYIHTIYTYTYIYMHIYIIYIYIYVFIIE